ncbi:MAG: peptidoglycan editing factor PgeF [Alphaproteobacteria bacterium]|nr:peptidoglycan editing factor PgeF [Alphaproteobacteria bacterium]
MSTPYLVAATLGHAEIAHGFFGRQGGVSEGPFDSLNCALTTGDRPEDINENRRRAAAALGIVPGNLVSTYQTHSADVVEVDTPWALDARPKADGMVTRRPGIMLGILTADCAPVLFADAQAGIIGAAHAGWRGAKLGIAEATVAAMKKLGAQVSRIEAVIGPCIAQASYEVGPEFPGPFLAEDPGNARFFRPGMREERHMFDLAGYVAHRLTRLGLRSVEHLDRDTCAEADRFFSYRRTCLAGEKKFGCELSAIALKG